MTRFLFLIFFSFLLWNCGKAPRDKKVVSADAQTSDGSYWAQLFAVNDQVARTAGNVLIKKFGDDLSIQIKVKGATAGLHAQYLHQGSSCPAFASDKNQDQYIDAQEMREVAGDIVLALDADLASHLPEDSFPTGRKYSYKKDTSYTLVTSNLGISDIPLEGKVIAIYGQSSLTLPGSVQLGSEKAPIPIACGVLTSGDGGTSIATDTWDEGSSTDRIERKPPRRRRPSTPSIRVPEPETRPPVDTRPWWRRWWDRVRGWFNSGND